MISNQELADLGLEVLGPSDLAAELGVSANTLYMRRSRGWNFPEPHFQPSSKCAIWVLTAEVAEAIENFRETSE